MLSLAALVVSARLQRVVLGLAVLLAWSASVHAQTPDQISRAKTHYEAGRALYNLGNYTDALREFLAGYELAPRREFLLNLGQTYRKLNDNPRAKLMYEKYLAEAPPDDPRREAIKRSLVEVEQRIAQEPQRPAPPDPTVARPADQAASQPAATNPALTATTAPPKKGFDKRHLAWIIPVTAVVLAGVAVGIYFGVRPAGACDGATIGCLDARGM
jgi:tetratricopeptide (TPR) repeat protein